MGEVQKNDNGKLYWRDGLKVIGTGLAAGVRAWLGLTAQDFREIVPESKTLLPSVLSRETVGSIDQVLPVSEKKVWAEMIELAKKYKVKIGSGMTGMGDYDIAGSMLLDTTPNSQTLVNENASEYLKVAQVIQGHARMFYANNTDLKTRLSYEEFYLKEYLPLTMQLIAREGVALDTYIGWQYVAELVSSTEYKEGANKRHNQDVYETKLQKVFGAFQMYLELKDQNTTLTDTVLTTNFHVNFRGPTASQYDGPRIAKVTSRMNDTELDTAAFAYKYLSDLSKKEFESKYPLIADELTYLCRARGVLEECRGKLESSCRKYIFNQGENGVLTRMLNDETHPAWEKIGWGQHPDWKVMARQSTSFTALWKLTYEYMHDGMARDEALLCAFKESKRRYIEDFRRDPETGMYKFMQQMVTDNTFLSMLRQMEKDTERFRLVDDIDFAMIDFLSQGKECRRSESVLSVILDQEEYNFDLQNRLFIGEIKYAADKGKKDCPTLSRLIKEYPQWENFLSLFTREVAPLSLLINSKEKFIRHRLIDDPYERETVMKCMDIIVTKIASLVDFYDDYSLLSVTRGALKSLYIDRDGIAASDSGYLSFLNSKKWKEDAKVQDALDLLVGKKGEEDLNNPGRLALQTADKLYGDGKMVVIREKLESGAIR